MTIPEIRYAKSGDVHLAYQVVGDATSRPRARPGLGLSPRVRVGGAAFLAFPAPPGFLLATDLARPPWHRAFRSRGRAAVAGAADGRCAGGDGRGRIAARGDLRHLRGRADGHDVRGDVSRARLCARALRDVRPAHSGCGLSARSPTRSLRGVHRADARIVGARRDRRRIRSEPRRRRAVPRDLGSHGALRGEPRGIRSTDANRQRDRRSGDSRRRSGFRRSSCIDQGT